MRKPMTMAGDPALGGLLRGSSPEFSAGAFDVFGPVAVTLRVKVQAWGATGGNCRIMAGDIWGANKEAGAVVWIWQEPTV